MDRIHTMHLLHDVVTMLLMWTFVHVCIAQSLHCGEMYDKYQNLRSHVVLGMAGMWA